MLSGKHRHVSDKTCIRYRCLSVYLVSGTVSAIGVVYVRDGAQVAPPHRSAAAGAPRAASKAPSSTRRRRIAPTHDGRPGRCITYTLPGAAAVPGERMARGPPTSASTMNPKEAQDTRANIIPGYWAMTRKELRIGEEKCTAAPQLRERREDDEYHFHMGLQI